MLPAGWQHGLGTVVGTPWTLRDHVAPPTLATDPVLHACPQPLSNTRYLCPLRSWGPPRGPLAAAVVPTCRQRAGPLAHGRARRGARLTRWRPIPSASHAPRPASGLASAGGGRRAHRPPTVAGIWFAYQPVAQAYGLGPWAPPEARRLSNLPSWEEGKAARASTLALTQHNATHASARMRAWTGSAGRAGTSATRPSTVRWRAMAQRLVDTGSSPWCSRSRGTPCRPLPHHHNALEQKGTRYARGCL